MVALVGFGAELGQRINRWIHIPSEPLLRTYQRAGDGFEGSIPDDEEVDVAAAPQLPPRRRAEDEGHSDLVLERGERFAKYLDGTRSLEEQSLELGEDGCVAIRLEMNLSPLGGPAKQAGTCERIELLLHRSLGRACLPDDLPEVERAVRMAEQQAEHTAAGLPEEDVPGLDTASSGPRLRTHFAYDCTHFAYDRQALGG